MDAEIRAALRAMSDPAILESIPTEALLAVAREALKRQPDALRDDVRPMLIAMVGDSAQRALLFEALPGDVLSSFASDAWDLQYRRRRAQEALEREERARRAREAEIRVDPISVPQKMNLTPLEGAMQRFRDGEAGFIRTTTPPQASDVNRIRALARRHGLSVRVRGNELFIVKGDA